LEDSANKIQHLTVLIKIDVFRSGLILEPAAAFLGQLRSAWRSAPLITAK
jgi:hypothetical protein